MSKIYGRRNGLWSPASNKGAARYGGVWNAFGDTTPPPLYEAVNYTNPGPSILDGNDNTVYTLGAKFYLMTAKPCYGLRWYTPTFTPPPNGLQHRASIYNRLSEEEIVGKNFDTTVNNDYMDILFDSPVNLSASPTDYVAAIFMSHYVYRVPTPSTGWDLTSPSGNVHIEESRLVAWIQPDYPASVTNAWYYISPLIGT
jgi:hypothetical protein